MFIVNPVAGRERMNAVVREAARLLDQTGFAVSVQRTTAAGDATRMARQTAEDTRAVIVVGGDGTVREVVTGLIGRRIPILPVPAGTECIVAKQCRMTAAPQRIADAVSDGQIVSVDVGLANETPFLIVMGVGFDAEVVTRLAASRGNSITHLSYFWPIVRTLAGHRFPRVAVEADGNTVFEGRGLVFAGMIPHYSIGLRLLRDAVWDDGSLDLCILPCSSRRGLLIHAGRVIAARHIGRGGVIYRKCKEVRISSSQPVQVEIDGDPAGHVPVEAKVLPCSARFLIAPAPTLDPQAGPRLRDATRC